MLPTVAVPVKCPDSSPAPIVSLMISPTEAVVQRQLSDASKRSNSIFEKARLEASKCLIFCCGAHGFANPDLSKKVVCKLRCIKCISYCLAPVVCCVSSIFKNSCPCCPCVEEQDSNPRGTQAT